MPTNSVAENVLGTMGAVCWMIQLVPQIWKSWREKSTKGLSHYLGLLWGISGAFLGVYVIVQDLNVPLIVQPQVLSFLSLLSWAQCQYYGNGRSFAASAVMFGSVLFVLCGFEVGMVFAIRPAYRAGNQRPVQFFGIMSSILLSSALFPQYYEIYKYREVIGISIAFMAVDLLGGVFSDLSLAFAPQFDVIAGVAYSAVVLLDGIVILLALILNPMARRRRHREQALSMGDAQARLSEQIGPVPEELHQSTTLETDQNALKQDIRTRVAVVDTDIPLLSLPSNSTDHPCSHSRPLS